MASYLKLFENHAQYDTFIGGGGDTPFVKPNVSYCVQENEVHYNPFSWADEYLTFVALEDGTFTFTPEDNNAISYSIDNGDNWSVGNSVELTKDSKVLWRGEMTPITNSGVGTFSSTGQFNVQGNAMSLLFGDDFKGQTDLTDKDYAFSRLFDSNSNLVNAQNLSLPATTLASSCYRGMFNGCTSLVNAPSVLPATRLATYCYNDMFFDCTSLVNAPELPATTLADYCYSDMFLGCTSLETAPELPATTLADYCYSEMFNGCTGLTSAPSVLPATTLAGSCYYFMFNDCTSLVNAPELPATTLAQDCYDSMFSGCTSLVTAPKLPATTLASYCYGTMFYGCTKLTTAPELPATTLANNCYNSMFSGCTSLVTAPTLPATILLSNCYYYMFNGCSSLNYIKAMFTTEPSDSYTDSWVSGVASKGTFVKNSAANWNVTGTSGIPSGWTVVTE